MRHVLSLALLTAVVGADYHIPEPAERFYVLADDWRLEGTQRIEVWHGQKGMRFGIDAFWMADRIDGNSICCGTHEVLVEKHLKAIAAKKKKPVLQLELCATTKGGPLFVAHVREVAPDAAARKRDRAVWKKLYAR